MKLALYFLFASLSMGLYAMEQNFLPTDNERGSFQEAEVLSKFDLMGFFDTYCAKIEKMQTMEVTIKTLEEQRIKDQMQLRQHEEQLARYKGMLIQCRNILMNECVKQKKMINDFEKHVKFVQERRSWKQLVSDFQEFAPSILNPTVTQKPELKQKKRQVSAIKPFNREETQNIVPSKRQKLHQEYK